MEPKEFTERVLAYGREEHLWHPGNRILAGVSGGPDSLALLLTLHLISTREKLEIGCCCVNHHLRENAAAEVDFVRSVCNSLKIPFYARDIYVRRKMKKDAQSVETVARTLRYEALRTVMTEGGWELLATAHHQDDQAETVLWHILRGSGMTGLRGIRPRNGDLIRPFLSVNRAEIMQFLGNFPYEPCHDETNDIPDCMRNRMRLLLLPELCQYNPNISKSLCRMAEIAGGEDLYMEKEAAVFWHRCAERRGNRWSMNIADFRSVGKALQRRIIRYAFETVCGSGSLLGFPETEMIRKLLCTASVGKMGSAKGLFVRMGYHEAVFLQGDTRTVRESHSGKISSPVPDGKWELSVEILTEPPKQLESSQCLLDADKIDGMVRLRTRRPGDLFFPRGMHGSVKLKKLMIDMKIPREKRADWPLAADDSTIYWVGLRRRSRCGVPDAHTVRYLLLTLRRRKHDGKSDERY